MTEEKLMKPIGSDIAAKKTSKEGYLCTDEVFNKEEKPALLLHSCCGPCSTSVIEQLYSEYKITVFFYNPNITNEDEYKKRKQAQKDFIEQFNAENVGNDQICFMEGKYEPGAFLEVAKGLENEREGGRRCIQCFKLRLEKTAQQAKMSAYDFFATTLTVSPYKDCESINFIGKSLAVKYDLNFLDRDFKKKGGFQRSIELSKKHGLYRQNYCGCDFV